MLISIQGNGKVKCKPTKLPKFMIYNRNVIDITICHGERYWATVKTRKS